MPKIEVSFKNTTKDMLLYSDVISQEEKSEYVKEALAFYKKYKGKLESIIDKGVETSK